MGICPQCKGKKILEYQAGLIQIRCPTCKGKGEISEDDFINGTGQLDTDIRSGDTSQSIKPQKRKTRKKATKRVS